MTLQLLRALQRLDQPVGTCEADDEEGLQMLAGTGHAAACQLAQEHRAKWL